MEELLRRHERASSVAVSWNGKIMFFCFPNGKVRRWDAESGESVGKPLQKHEMGVRWVVLSADGRLTASESWDKTV